MSNIHGLFSSRRSSSGENSNNEENRYVGGIGAQGGGSGLAVQPNPSNDLSPSDATTSIFSQAEQQSSSDSVGNTTRRRTITMYQSGFIVDDGHYRRLNDPANREFLTALAQGRVPRELTGDADNGDAPVEVGLIDKRKEEYVEPTATFMSFSGAGESLGSSTIANEHSDGVIVPPTSTTESSTMPPPSGDGVTSVQIRLLSGKRVVIKISKEASVTELGERLNNTGMAGSEPYMFVTGFPPKPILNMTQTVDETGLAGASVQQKKA